MGYQNLAKTLRNQSNLVGTPKKCLTFLLRTIQDVRHTRFSIFILYYLKFILSWHMLHDMAKNKFQMYNSIIQSNMADFQQIQDGRLSALWKFRNFHERSLNPQVIVPLRS